MKNKTITKVQTRSASINQKGIFSTRKQKHSRVKHRAQSLSMKNKTITKVQTISASINQKMPLSKKKENHIK